MNKIAIYTAIVGGYDKILQPLVTDNRFDYILFSNDIAENQVGVWHVRPIPYHNNIQTKIARWVKTHPEELLPQYEATLWMDANIQIISYHIYDQCVKIFQNGISIAGVQHPERNCIYDEAIICMLFQFETETIILPWLQIIQKEGYPHDNGLTETNILFRTQKTNFPINQKWWKCIEDYSRRDQLSFDYVLWKARISLSSILPDGQNAKNCDWIRLEKHKNTTQKKLPLTSKDFPFLYHYLKLFPYKDYWNFNFNKLYLSLYTSKNPILKARIKGLYYWIWLHVWRSIKGEKKT